MILDGENTFFDKKELSAATIVSDVVAVGEGESGCPMELVLSVSSDAGEGTLSTVLQTSSDEAFTDPVALGTYTAVPLAVHVPRGNLGYLRLSATSTFSKGTMTAGLVLDDDIRVKD